MLALIKLLLFLVLQRQHCATVALISKQNDTDQAVARTLSSIYAGDTNRVVGLFCKVRCPRQRELLSSWIQSFNEELKLSLDDRAKFHFHIYKRPLGVSVIDSVLNQSNIEVFYFVADQGFQYKNNINSEHEFKEWLRQYENASIQQIDDHGSLNILLNQAVRSCEDGSLRHLLMIQDMVECTDTLLPNIARSFIQDPTINVAELRRPLSLETEASLYWRLPGLSDSCRIIIFLHKGSYYEVEKNTLPSKLYVMLKNWKGGNCNLTSINNIRPEINGLQLDYMVEEFRIRKIHNNQTYIAVGSIGGLAVIALAISIFWGLQSA